MKHKKIIKEIDFIISVLIVAVLKVYTISTFVLLISMYIMFEKAVFLVLIVGLYFTHDILTYLYYQLYEERSK